MNFDKIKYFIDLVECRNFTETAKKNFVSQTTISLQIASLEEETDIQLIDRKKIPIEPTQAGWLFYDEAITLWKQYNHMKTILINYKMNHDLTIRVEYAAATDIQSMLRLMPSFKEKNPNIKLELDKVLLKDVSEYLLKGLYDIAIAFDSEFKDKPDILTYPLYRGQYCAVVSRSHPLFHHKIISKDELYQYPLIMLNPESIGSSYELMIQHAALDGYHPQIVRFADDIETELFYIVTENLIGFFPDNYNPAYLENDIRMIPLDDTNHTFRIEIAYLKNNKNIALKHFLKHIQN
ncbi:LysR family transcriptional regulator [Lacrimispora sp.]|uniref:LysR family transcriptional regulator n=1 Tax=Lacrimispora sp. TaxID=2719234 RepID=UPI0032E518B1